MSKLYEQTFNWKGYTYAKYVHAKIFSLEKSKLNPQ